MSAEFVIDRYGFRSTPQERPRPSDVIRENARMEKWQEMLLRWDYNVLRRSEWVRRRIRKGIPDSFRGRVWAELANLKQLKEENETGYYRRLAETEIENKATRDIQLDINRTFPDNILFSNEGIGQQTLFRVLKAYALHDPEIGYCQGMGFLTGLFLFYMQEEDAFWMLVAVMKKYEMREFYMPGMPGVYKAFYKVNALVKQYLPTLFRHFEEIGISPSMFVPSWLMTLYINYLPTEVALRILDVFFNEGPKILYRIYILIFKEVKDELLELTADKIFNRVKTIPDSFNPDETIRKVFKISLGRARLKDLEKEYENSRNN